MAYYIPKPENVGGHVPLVPHQIASMDNLRSSAVYKSRATCINF